jgi:hypothetical protein
MTSALASAIFALCAFEFRFSLAFYPCFFAIRSTVLAADTSRFPAKPC